ncbi:MAG: amino acid/amide transporter rane protein 2, family [Acidimicrobiales bacterium]|nr:amino acid/amide transporter rane protein 2, family [Acidimicrobiales bacterium]
MATALEPEAASPEVHVVPTKARAGFRPTPAGWAARSLAVALPGLIVVWYVHHYAPVRADFLAGGVIIAIGALSLNVLVGYTGQISLGHQAFIGIGAFTSAYFIGESGQSFYVGMIAAIVVGAVQAVVLGLIALRVRGLYFALVTLAWGFVGEQSIFQLKSFTGGGAGAHATRPGGFTTDRMFLVFCAIVLTLILLVDWRLVATKAGRALQAIRENPQVAANYGINVKGYTLFSFAVAGVYAGLAGALFASRRDTVSATDLSFYLVALPYLLVTVVGGLRRRGGIVVFAMLFVLGGEYLPDLAKSLHIKFIQENAGNIIQSLSGVLAVLTLIFQPDGVGTITAPIGRWLKGERFSMHVSAGGGAEGVSVRP